MGQYSGTCIVSQQSYQPSSFPSRLIFCSACANTSFVIPWKQDPLAMEDQCVFIRGFRAKRLLFGIRIMDIGGGSRVIPFRRRTQRNNGLRSAPSSLSYNDHRGSSSSLDTIRPINHENSHWQLLPYPSSTTLPNNGSVYNASFMTSPSYGSLMEVLNDIAEVCLPEIGRASCRERV